MVKTKDGDGIKSNIIISEVQKKPCLFDTNHPHYGDRSEKAKSWEEVCENVVPAWSHLNLVEKFAAGKEVQKRWRSIRDSFTKSYRQGKCVQPDQCAPGSRRYQYHKQMSFLLRALQNKRPRLSQDKYESFSELSNSPQHHTEDFLPKIKTEPIDKTFDLKTKPEILKAIHETTPNKKDKTQQTNIETVNKKEIKNPSVEIKVDANSILPDDNFDDDKLFMNSLLPLFKKMDDDTRLLCRIEVLKIVRYALQGHKCFQAIKLAEDSFFKDRISSILKEDETNTKPNESIELRSDVNRPIRKRKAPSPSPLPSPPKKRGPGRPRKIRPPPSDSEEEAPSRRKTLKIVNLEPRLSELDEELSKATSVAQLRTPLFMKMYNLERTKKVSTNDTRPLGVTVKTEPKDYHDDNLIM